MSRWAKVLIGLLAVAAIAGIVVRINAFFGKDPFARYRISSQLGIEMKGVTVKHYNGSKLTGTVFVDKVEVPQDHQSLDFFGIHGGHFNTTQGPITYNGQAGSFNVVTGQLVVNTPGHVTAKNLDLVTSSFLFDQQTMNLTMPGGVHGTADGGQIVGTNLVYRGRTGGYSFKGDWMGVPPKEAGLEVVQAVGPSKADSQSQAPTKTRWHITGEVDFLNGVANYTDMRAEDGEILVTAPRGSLDQHTDVLTLDGPVRYYSEKANCECDHAVIYRKEKKAVLTGHVHMLVKPKDQERLQVSEIPPWKPPVPSSVAQNRPPAPQSAEAQQEKDLDDELRSSKTQRKYPAHVKADEVDYWYAKGNRHAIIKGSPDCYQELAGGRWRRVVTHVGYYDGEKDELTLQSSDGTKDTRVVDSLDDDFVATKFTVSTKEDDDKYSASGMDGNYSSDEEDELAPKSGGNGAAKPNTPSQAPTSPPVNPAPATPPGGPPRNGA
jgi:hypothetical protein